MARLMKGYATMSETNSLCLMAVHAHPDDECFQGGVFGRYADEGARTVLVTCTLGEEGEIVDPSMDEAAVRPRLAEVRTEELRCSVATLGIGQLHLLGYRDSGMAGTPANAHPLAFNNVRVETATARLVALVRAERPQVMITYDERGGYGHPDHIMAHRIAVAAYEGAGDATRFPVTPGGPEPWQPSKLYSIAWPIERMIALRQQLIERGLPDPFARAEESAQSTASGDGEGQERPSFMQPESAITTDIDVAPYVERKLASFRCHRTQLAETAFPLALPADVLPMVLSHETFILARSRVPSSRPESDLFAGVR
jgi:mycothiol conjugate amidase Mca